MSERRPRLAVGSASSTWSGAAVPRSTRAMKTSASRRNDCAASDLGRESTIGLPSFTERVNELRLQRAFALLIEPHGSARRISDIALEVGFSDISHFNRLFRTRFGVSPRSVRGAGGMRAESRDADP